MRLLVTSVSTAVVMACSMGVSADAASQPNVMVLTGGSGTGSGEASSSPGSSGGSDTPKPTAMIKRVPAEENDKNLWTPERYKNARPMPLPTPDAGPAPRAAEDFSLQDQGKSKSSEGRGPTVKVKPDLDNLLFEPDPVEPKRLSAPSPAPYNVGAQGAHFSSSRVFPDQAYLSPPFMMIGKLFFTIPGQGDAVCSASVLRKRIVLTAGHCVHTGSGSPSGWFTNFRFVPAHDSGRAPFGTWTPRTVITTGEWFSGGGQFPNAQDIAMFDMNDRTINSSVRKIGDVTGYLGYQTGRLAPNHAHLVGYPVGLDNGLKMHWVASESFAPAGNNTIWYGSDMAGGSSGGPWIQNLGIPAAGQIYGGNRAPNAVIGVTSFGYTTDPTQQVAGSSIPDSRFVSILNTICTHRSGNC